LFSQCKSSKSTDNVDVAQKATSAPVNGTTGDIEGLVGVKWTHNREDDKDGLLNYLNGETNTFPPSRFRNALFFNADGTCAYMQLSPTDQHHMIDGTYTYANGQITISQANGQQYKSYEVVEVAKDTLILKQIR